MIAQPIVLHHETPSHLRQTNNQTMNDITAGLSATLANTNLYLKTDLWFEHLQDPGIPMTEEEKPLYQTNANVKKPKYKTRHISHNDSFYPDLYKLASMVQSKLDENRESFCKLPKKSTAFIHNIGLSIAECYCRVGIRQYNLHS